MGVAQALLPYGVGVGSLLQAVELQWGQAQVDFALVMDWWCCGHGSRVRHNCFQACTVNACLLSSSEPTRHLLRQLSEKGECEG